MLKGCEPLAELRSGWAVTDITVPVASKLGLQTSPDTLGLLG